MGLKNFVIGFFLIYPIIVISQNFNYGFQGGINSSSIRGFEYEDDYNTAIAFNIGASLEYRFSQSVSSLINISYDRKSVEKSYNSFDPSQGFFVESSSRLNHNYLTIPLLIRYRIEKGKFGFFINIGGFVGFLQSVTNNKINIDTSTFEKHEFGIVGGVGALYKIDENFNLTFEIRDNFGLTNLRSVPIDYNNGVVKTNSINVLLGFSFKL